MKVIMNENTVRIFEGSAEMLDLIPNGYYTLEMNILTGLYLQKATVNVIEEKMYGNYKSKISKILKNFKQSKRNFGAILSGKKGMGKSSFAKKIAEEAVKEMPVLLVDKNLNGMAGFLNSIEQECLILFDEFEKTFKQNQEEKEQDQLLSLLDGISAGKKLFVITCNELDGLSDYMLNRPGRFHYHFKFNKPSYEELTEYLNDNLLIKKEYQKILDFALRVELNFDCLRALCFEINEGSELKEALEDLNISNSNERSYYNVIIKDKKTGETIEKVENKWLNLTSDQVERVDYYDEKEDKEFVITFRTKNIKTKVENFKEIFYLEKIEKLEYYNDKEEWEQSNKEEIYLIFEAKKDFGYENLF